MKTKLLAFATALLLAVPGMARADQSAVSVLNELLKGELSAVETYKQALDKISPKTGTEQLKKYQSEHQQAASTLEQHVVKLGGEPAKSSGAWGAWAKAVEGTAKVFGETAALKALKEGEEHGVKEYKELLENKNAPSDIKEVVRNEILPKQEEHIQGLDALMNVKQNS